MQTGVNSLSVPIGTRRWWWGSEAGELVPIQVTVALVKDESEIEAYEQRLEDSERRSGQHENAWDALHRASHSGQPDQKLPKGSKLLFEIPVRSRAACTDKEITRTTVAYCAILCSLVLTQPDLCCRLCVALLYFLRSGASSQRAHAIQVMPLELLHLGPTVQITVPSGKVRSEALPSLEEWIDNGGPAREYKPGAMMRLSAEGLRVSDLPPPPRVEELDEEQDDDALSTAAPAPLDLPIVRCLYDQTFCHIHDSDTSEEDPSMRRVYSPTLSSGGSLIRNSPER
jgi:hypothetical protein